jgi:outer membrane immunogenic protein
MMNLDEARLRVPHAVQRVSGAPQMRDPGYLREEKQDPGSAAHRYRAALRPGNDGVAASKTQARLKAYWPHRLHDRFRSRSPEQPRLCGFLRECVAEMLHWAARYWARLTFDFSIHPLGAVMKKLVAVAAAIAAFGFASAASAADMPAKAPVYKAPIAAPTYNWTGIYVGINGGIGWGREDWTDNVVIGFPPGSPVSLRPDGGVFGGQVGFRWQWNQLVLGIEGTWDWAGLRDTVTPAAGITEEFKVKSLYTATAQVGWAWDRVLIYAKGGWAGATTSAELNLGTTVSNSQSVSGWTVGGGVDYAVWQNVIVGVEYDHFDFNYDPFTAAFPPPGTPWIVTNTSRLTVDQVVARLSYKFDWPR